LDSSYATVAVAVMIRVQICTYYESQNPIPSSLSEFDISGT